MIDTLINLPNHSPLIVAKQILLGTICSDKNAVSWPSLQIEVAMRHVLATEMLDMTLGKLLIRNGNPSYQDPSPLFFSLLPSGGLAAT